MNAKILIVDASATDRMIIQNMLADYTALTACDGVEAMARIEENPDIDLVLLDLNMPNMDGFQVLEALSDKSRYKDLRTIILTNYDELDKEIRGLNAGAVDYIRKPIHMESLIVRIEIHIQFLRIQRLLLQELHVSNVILETVFDQAPVGIAVAHGSEAPYDKDNPPIINKAFERIAGRSKDEIAALGWAEITHPDDREKDLDYFRKFLRGEINGYNIEKRYIRPDGSIVWVDMIVAQINILNDSKYNHICIARDITERKIMERALNESERSKSVLLSNLPGLAYRCNYDKNWTMQFVSQGCFALTGYLPESLINNRDLSFNDIIAPEYRGSLWHEWERRLSRNAPFTYEYEIITAGRQRKWVLEKGQGVYDNNGNLEALEGIIIDITDRKEYENSFKYMSEHDTGVGLYNRRYFDRLLKQDARSGNLCKRAVMVVNLNAINLLSLTYGFHYSQGLIKKIAESLTTHCDKNCQLFYTYTNRFTFYIKNYKDKGDLIVRCEAISKTLEALLSAERVCGGIGVYEIDESISGDVEQMGKKVLIASENALNNPNRDFSYCFFDSEMEARVLREEEIKNELSQIASDENNSSLYLQFQPIVKLNSNRICCFEALARLKSDRLGLVSPLEFIPLAEKTKLIVPIGHKIMRQSFSFLKELSNKGYTDVSVSVNISAIQLIRQDFNTVLFELINEAQINPANIILEITESVFSDNYHEINRKLGELKASGIRIAIDDFGTGYSSLSRESELNINCLKIDKYFIDKLLSLSTEEAITGDIISMAHKLGHCVVAEGVEYDKQRQYLVDCGCDKIQGYMISRPLDYDEAIMLLKGNRSDI